MENFDPNQGYVTRKVYFGNQSYRTKVGQWIVGEQTTFSHCATAKAGVRRDYKGGYDNKENKFFLQNCGFFNDCTPFGKKFSLNRKNKPPLIDFELLESL